MSPTPPPTPPTPPRYDFGTADYLEGQLRVLADKLSGLCTQRQKSATTNLGQNDGHTLDGRWLGARRNEFDGKFGGQQAALTALAAQASKLIAAVHQATADANAKYAKDVADFNTAMRTWKLTNAQN